MDDEQRVFLSRTTTMASKKRKRDVDDADTISFQLAQQPATQLGPVLASFPALKPSHSTSFRCYLRKEAGHDDGQLAEFAAQPTLLVGEADSVEFFSSYEETQKAQAAGCRYLIGVHNKRTRVTTLRPAPVHVLTRQVKALKALEPTGKVSARQRLEARAALGEAFGTKKAKAAIKAQERNKMDVSAMESVADHLQDRIEQSTGTLPTQEQAKAVADDSRLIPPCNANATEPADVYALHDIVPEAEWKALSVSALTSADSDEQRIAALPYCRSTWVNQHLTQAFISGTPSKRTLKLLYVISAMLAFRATARAKVEKTKLYEKLSGIPTTVIDGFVARFTETSRGTSTSQVTTQTQTILLTHLFALCLRADNYSTDTTLIAADLSMGVGNVNKLFKSLGCKIEKPSDKELQRLGLAGDRKRAVLKTPVVFPKLRRRKAA